MDSQTILVGKVLKAHAMGGAVKVRSYAESPDVYEKGRRLWAVDAGGRRRSLTVLWSRPGPRGCVLAFHEVDTRNGAEEMAGLDLHMDRSALPEAGEGAYYWVDLIGLEVTTAAGESVGRLHEVLRTGSNDVFVVRQGDRETLVPALESVVVSVDIEGGGVVVDLPEGL